MPEEADPYFFAITKKRVENIGRCGNSRLPAARSGKPHDKPNLKREESVRLLKVSRGKRVGFFETFFFLFLSTTSVSLGSIPLGLTAKCERSHISIPPPLLPPLMHYTNSSFLNPLRLLRTIRGRLSPRLRLQLLNLLRGSSNSRAVRPKKARFRSSGPGFAIYLSQTASEAFLSAGL